MYRSIKWVINISLIIGIVSASVFLLLCMSPASAKASSSYVHFATTGGMSSAGDGPQQIVIIRDGDTSNESIKVIVDILNSSLGDSEYQYGPTVVSWDAGDNSSKNLTVTVPATIKDDMRQTITFGLVKVEGNGNLSEPTIYEMVVDFPINEPVATPTPVPTPTPAPSPTAIATTDITTIVNGSKPVPQNNTANNSTAVSPNETNNTTSVPSNAQDMPIVMFGGLVSLAVLITAGYLLLFKRK
ncbi:MAG TPA: hypothetical protein VGK13_03965 [Methanocellaceae archaeon]